MPVERIDTRGDYLNPGHYTFTIVGMPVKGEFSPGKNYYEFEFMTKVGSHVYPHKERIPVWMIAPYLRAIGVPESERDVFDWDKTKSIGATFDAEIVMESYVGKDGQTKQSRKIKNPVAIAGFPRDHSFVSGNKDEEAAPF